MAKAKNSFLDSTEGRGTGNSRNGISKKTLKGQVGEIEISTPRDRQGTFSAQFIKKGQTRFTEFDDQILALYSRGMTTRDIAATFKEMYGAEVSHTLVSKVTEAVINQVRLSHGKTAHWMRFIPLSTWIA